MNKIRTWLKGKKTYITATIGLLGAVAAWADGQIDTLSLVAAVWVAIEAVFLRVAIEASGPPKK